MRAHSDEQIAQIAASIAEFGFVNPILIGDDGVVIAGHGRLLAAQRLGITEVPVIVLDHLTDAQRRALVIADNRIAENAGWDRDLLRAELAALSEQQFDLDLLGFAEAELTNLLETIDVDASALSPEARSEKSEEALLSSNSRRTLRNSALLGPQCARRLVAEPQACLARSWHRSELGRGAPIGGAPLPLDRADASQRRALPRRAERATLARRDTLANRWKISRS